MPIPRCYAVVKKDNRGMIMQIFSVWMDHTAAYESARNANQWYGEGHPLTPLEVVDHDTLFEPRPFPEFN